MTAVLLSRRPDDDDACDGRAAMSGEAATLNGLTPAGIDGPTSAAAGAGGGRTGLAGKLRLSLRRCSPPEPSARSWPRATA
jgi:hypothetical protein